MTLPPPPAHPGAAVTQPLQLLILEDSPLDAELAVHVLRRDGMELEWRRVETRADFLAALDPAPDLVLADYSLPQYNALLALKDVQERAPDIPFIIITGTVSEEVTVECMKQGAADYLLKDRLARLPQAIRRALEERTARLRQQEAEQRQRASERRFRALIENSYDGVLLVDPTGRILYGTDSNQRLLGYPPEELIGRSMLDFIHPDALSTLPRLTGGPGQHVLGELQVRRRDGGWVWIEGTATDLLDDPDVRAIVINYRDITLRKQALAALRESEDRFRRLAENAQDLIFRYRLTPPAGFDYVSPATMAITGYTPEELYADPDLGRTIVFGDGQQALAGLMDRPEQPASGTVLRLVRKDGPLVWIEARNSIVTDAAGKPRAIEGIVRDVTERKRQEEEQLQLLEQLRERVKEQTTLCRVAQLLHDRAAPVPDLLRQLVTLLPEGWRYPDAAAVRIRHRDWEIASPGFRETPWMQRVVLRDNATPTTIDMVYLDERPAADEGPFLQEERGLLNAVGSMLWSYLAQRRAQDALVANEERFRALIERSSDGIVLLDADGLIVYFSPSSTAITGYRADAVVGRNALDFVHPDHRPTFTALLEQLVSFRQSVSAELQLLHVDGSAVWVEGTAANLLELPSVQAIVVNYRDITERKKMEQQLEHQALHDALTGLPNRTLLLDRLGQHLLAAARQRGRQALLVLDLDRFKDINDTFGHAAGDALLREVAGRLREAVRESDTVARLGGDEFAVTTGQAGGVQGALVLASRLLATFDRPFTVAGVQVAVHASLGIAVAPDHGNDPDTLFRHADVAMYAAKRARSGYAVYALEQDPNSPDRLALVAELRDAIRAGQLALDYQPLRDLRTGAVPWVEALARWPHPQRGLLAPGQFIPLAEQNGLVHALSKWVLDTALRQLWAWGEQGIDLGIAVNLSAHDLQDRRLPDWVGQRVAYWGVAPARLMVELTESALVEDFEIAVEVLGKLRAMGVKAAVDDFGTGYASLSYLRQFPVDELKIDLSFVQGARTDPRDAAVVRAAIVLGHSLGLTVAAEGVESADVLDYLRAEGCDLVQGYAVQRPLPAADLHQWLASIAAAGPSAG